MSVAPYRGPNIEITAGIHQSGRAFRSNAEAEAAATAVNSGRMGAFMGNMQTAVGAGFVGMGIQGIGAMTGSEELQAVGGVVQAGAQAYGMYTMATAFTGSSALGAIAACCCI